MLNVHNNTVGLVGIARPTIVTRAFERDLPTFQLLSH
jgi:hypothetical protein